MTMPWTLIYNMLKDALKFGYSIKSPPEGEPIVVAPPLKNALDNLLKNEQVKGKPEDFSWCSPRKLHERTSGTNAEKEIVFVKSSRAKQRVITRNSSGQEDLILIRKRSNG